MIWCQWLAKCSIDGSIDEWNHNEKIMLQGVCFVDGFIDGWWQCVLSNIGSFDLFYFILQLYEVNVYLISHFNSF